MAGLLGKIASMSYFIQQIFHICYVWIIFKLRVAGWFNCRSLELLMAALDTGEKSQFIADYPRLPPRGVLQISSDRDDRRIFWVGLKFLISGFLQVYFFWQLDLSRVFLDIQNNLKICDSYIIWCFLEIFMAWKFGNFDPGIFLVYLKPQDFGFEFCPHLITPVTWNPE